MTRAILRQARSCKLPAAFLVLLASMVVAVQPASARPKAMRFTNPVLGQGQDPSVATYHRRYYLVQSSPHTMSITIRRARSIKALAASVKHVIWRGGESGSPCCHWWGSRAASRRWRLVHLRRRR